jgi:hypothetical protein
MSELTFSIQVGFGSVSTEYWLGTDALRLLTTYHAFVARVELSSPDVDVGYLYAEFDRFLVTDDIIMYQSRYTSKPHAVPPDEAVVDNLLNMAMENPDNCGMTIGSGWLTYDFSTSSCLVAMLINHNNEMFWTLASGTLVRVTKATVRIRPVMSMGKCIP